MRGFLNLTKRKKVYKDNVFVCERCGRKTRLISFENSVTAKYCNSCKHNLASGGTGNLLEFPCRDKDGNIDFNREKYEIKKEMKHLGLAKSKKRRKNIKK